MPVDIQFHGVGRQRVLIVAPHERLDRHLVVAGVVLAPQAVLLLGRGEAQTQTVGDILGDVLTGLERLCVGEVDDRAAKGGGGSQRHACATQRNLDRCRTTGQWRLQHDDERADQRA